MYRRVVYAGAARRSEVEYCVVLREVLTSIVTGIYSIKGEKGARGGGGGGGGTCDYCKNDTILSG